MRIGVFGGTFDPPHMGHLELASIVLESGLVDRVIFVPCLKHALGKSPAGFEHRFAMCKVLVEGKENMDVSDIESRLDTGGRTLDLLKGLTVCACSRGLTSTTSAINGIGSMR